MEDINKGIVYILEDNGKVVGTGSLNENHITRVYVLPFYQGKGYGKYIVNQLELLMGDYEEIILDASLPACQFYEHLGGIIKRLAGEQTQMIAGFQGDQVTVLEPDKYTVFSLQTGTCMPKQNSENMLSDCGCMK